ncbi:MAG: molybdate ABC transporter substrate-binding protein [Sphingomonadaceae bacterium]|nr:molybdate ABC transporter substrate-binding protein [Sphingomonadaceae bacterium]
MRLFCALLLLIGIASPAAAAPPAARVYAASSLTEAMTAIADAYAASGKPRPILSFGASSALARQLERGAPPGIFVSADLAWPAYLARQRLVLPASRRTIAGNRLVLVVPADRPRRTRIGRGFDLAAFIGPQQRWTTGDPQAVPVGRYARQALVRLGAWPDAAPRLARAENVRAALAFVERGDAAAGIVYETDARASRKVVVAGRFPAASHDRIVYPALLTRGAGSEARDFHQFLTSERARDLLAARGFTRP